MNPQIHPEIQLISRGTESLRHTVNALIEPEKRGALGQYMTPCSTADFMASLFPEPKNPFISLLDPGAGIASLTSAFISRAVLWSAVKKLESDSWEIDPTMIQYLHQNLKLIQNTKRSFDIDTRILTEDFIVYASSLIANSTDLWAEPFKKYTHCIMNPPYKKILSTSIHRKCLRTVGIETVNLYTGFVALALMLMEEGGQLVAIIPRSFCNGTYYRPFREHILGKSAIRHIHIFESRNRAFKDDDVLQENIIIQLERGANQDDVTISNSTDNSFSNLESRTVPFKQIVSPQDKEFFIHIPLNNAPISNSSKQRYTLETLDIQVSTGSVVDFRLKDKLLSNPEQQSVPLLYPCHLKSIQTVWPVNGKKPNAIALNNQTKKLLYPKGFYVLVRRFSSKEEKRRIVASVLNPKSFQDYEYLAFENHLNVFHHKKQGLDESLAWGLVAFLNTKSIDDAFRVFSGHTQVNATDLRSMWFPSIGILRKLGDWAKEQPTYDDDMTEAKLKELEQWQSTITVSI